MANQSTTSPNLSSEESSSSSISTHDKMSLELHHVENGIDKAVMLASDTSIITHNAEKLNIVLNDRLPETVNTVPTTLPYGKLVSVNGVVYVGNLSGVPVKISNESHTHTKSQITDFPSSLPASDVYSWAKASSKPSYSWNEITGKPSTFTPSAHSHSEYLPLSGGAITGGLIIADHLQIRNSTPTFIDNTIAAGSSTVSLCGNNNTVKSGPITINGNSNVIGSGDYYCVINGADNTINDNSNTNFISGFANTVTGGNCSGMVGNNHKVFSFCGFTAGNANEIHNDQAFAAGYNNKIGTTEDSNTSIALGYQNTVNGKFAACIGLGNVFSGGQSGAAIGDSNHVSKCSFALGLCCNSSGDTGSFATGGFNNALGASSFVSGHHNTCYSANGLSIGNNNVSGIETNSLEQCITIGYQNTATGSDSFALGCNNNVSGNYSMAEGRDNIVSGSEAAAIGRDNTVTDLHGIAMGESCVANAECSVVIGYNCVSNVGFTTVIGYNNIPDNEKLGVFIIGNGTPSKRSNCFRVDPIGVVYSKGSYNSSGADYAEYFEWEDGNPDNEDRVGRFVTLNGKYISICESINDFILGIVSGNPTVCGDVYDDQWQGMYETDIYGRPIFEDVEIQAEYREVEIPAKDKREYHPAEYEEIENEAVYEDVETVNDKGDAVINSILVSPARAERKLIKDAYVETKIIQEAYTKKELVRKARVDHRQKINPNYNNNQKYISRSDRPEWSPVGMLGKLVVNDDGTSNINDWVKPTTGGIATKSAEKTKFRVMERLDDTHIRVLIV